MILRTHPPVLLRRERDSLDMSSTANCKMSETSSEAQFIAYYESMYVCFYTQAVAAHLALSQTIGLEYQCVDGWYVFGSHPSH